MVLPISRNFKGEGTFHVGAHPKETVMKAKNTARRRIKPERESPQINRYWIAGILFSILVFTTFLYSNSLKNGFIYFDDPELVLDNLFIRQLSWGNVVHFFSTPVQMTYLPIGLISYAIDYRIGGLNPLVYHLHSLLIHLITILLVYWLFQLLTRKPTVSIFGAIIFAIHPVNVDGVVWVATRNNLLATFFYLGSIIFYVYYLQKNLQVRFLVFSFIAFALSCLSKSSSVVLPFALFLVDFFMNRKWDKRLLLEKIPFFLLSLILGVLTLKIRTDVIPPVAYSLVDRFFLFFYTVINYFYRLLLPINLSMSYAYPNKVGLFLPMRIYLAPLFTGLVIWGLYELGVRKKALITGLSFFALNIFLSQSVLLIDNFMANRYVYLSYIGLFFILADINDQILTAKSGWKSKIRIGWITALVIFTAFLSFLTYNRVFVWKDTISLFDDVIAKQPNIPWVYSNRGVAKFRNNDFEGALRDFNQSLALDPNFALSLYYRGVIEHLSGKNNEALTDLNKTITLVPSFAPAFNERGKLKQEFQDIQGALEDFSASISINPYFAEPYLNRGVLKSDQGDFPGAVADYSTAISLDPGYTIAYENRGLAEIHLAYYKEALSDFSRVIELDPAFGEAYYMRGVAKMDLHDPGGSCDDQKKAFSLGYQTGSGQVIADCP
jgi:tetratricopeptide (TPR) repeat protein